MPMPTRMPIFCAMRSSDSDIQTRPQVARRHEALLRLDSSIKYPVAAAVASDPSHMSGLCTHYSSFIRSTFHRIQFERQANPRARSGRPLL